jgi:hypothetical protein
MRIGDIFPAKRDHVASFIVDNRVERNSNPDDWGVEVLVGIVGSPGFAEDSEASRENKWNRILG